MSEILFSETRIGSRNIKNRIVMAPMTRSRALNNVPNELMAEYYGQRSGMGLIITEGTAPSPNGLGYARIPGIWLQTQIAGWKRITELVHENGSVIFLQIMHTGRVGHPENMPQGSDVLGPSAVAAKGEIFTDTSGLMPLPVPREMNLSDIRRARDEFVRAAENAMEAGFDGVELHGANGYLLDQFLQPDSNRRIDIYGGSVENRCRFVLEVASSVSEAVGKDRTGIRLSPYGVSNDVSAFPETEEQYVYLASEINRIGLVYIHLVNHSSMGAPEVPMETVEKIRKAFRGKLILCGGYDAERAAYDLMEGPADLIAFGRPAIANPDLALRLESGAALNIPDRSTFYTPGEKGYTDYPFLNHAE